MAAAGTNELIGLLLTGCFAVVLAGAALRRRALARLACLLLVTAAATAVTLLVPGTLERMRSAVPPGGRHVIQALGPSLAVAGRHSLEWIASPLAPAAWLLGLGVARIAATDEGWSLPHPAIAGAALAAAYFATVFLPYYGAGTLEKHTLNLAHALFTGGGLFLAACTGAWMGQRRRPATVWASVLRAGAWTLMVALAVLPPTPLRTAYGDLASGRAARYDQALLDRYELIAQCRYVVCGVPPLSDPPPSLFWFENAADEAKDAPSMLSYKDDTFAAFFGKARIRLTGQAPATTAHP